MKETKIVELVIADDSQELAIDAISLVTSPAIETDFVYFGKEKNNLTFAKVDEEKRELISPALIPNKQIFRYDPNTDSDYYVYFSKDTVKQAAYLYLKHNNHHKATYQHQDRVSGVLTVESWIKEGDSDKSNMYGFDLPVGTWFVKMRIENDELWNKIKEGELKGLSIEGYFVNKMETMSKKEFTTEEVRTALKELLSVQKVELANYDFKGYMKEYDKSFSNYRTDFRKGINAAKGVADKHFTDVIKIREKAENEMDDFGTKAKELGIDFRKTKQWGEFQDLKKILLSRETSIKEKLKEISKIL